jgi:hypothetical protein
MRSLGVDKYVTQGGDWVRPPPCLLATAHGAQGYFISSTLASLFPERVRGMHVNLFAGSLLTGNPKPQPGVARFEEFSKRGAAYQQMHFSVPYVSAVLGARLADNQPDDRRFSSILPGCSPGLHRREGEHYWLA